MNRKYFSLPIAAIMALAANVNGWGQSTPETDKAEELISYANLLGTRGEVSKIGDKGLAIEGDKLEGEATRSPRNALSRAAELYAEAAIAGKNVRSMAKALSLWDRIRNPSGPIPYLRLYSKNAETNREPFALFCLSRLGAAYESSEDFDSAAEVYSRCAKIEAPKSDMEVEAVAFAAQFALGRGDQKLAAELATRACSGADPNKFTFVEGASGPSIALAVLRQIPGATLPEISSDKKTPNANKETNARGLLTEGNVAIRAKDYPRAIECMLEYKRQFPNEDASRTAVLRAAALYESLKQPEKALELYSSVEAQYAQFAESWQATLKAVRIIENLQGRDAALQHLRKQRDEAKTPEAAAQLTLTLAKAFLDDRKNDEAAEMYITLLTKYGSQDAAKGVLPQLKKLSPQIKDWQKFSLGIQNWLIQERSAANQGGLSASEASNLRRLALTYYAKSNNVNSGIKWLKEVTAGDSIDADYAARDQAWFLAQTGTYLVEQSGSMDTRVREDAVAACLSGWKLAGKTQEGFMCLQTAQALAIKPSNSPRKLDRDLEKELNSLLTTDRKQQGFDMLAAYYEYLGDKRALAQLKQQNLQAR